MSGKIGDYDVLEELGQGGLARVYRAYDAHLAREVALKLFHPELTLGPEFPVRFDRALRMTASLEHTAIVPIYHFSAQEKQLFIVMRYMVGRSLADLLTGQGPQAIPWAVKLLQRLAPALDEAHRRHIFHSDLKPQNILFDAQGEAYLSDFGIISVFAGGENILGAPAYLSPEQARGERADGRSDVYALGVILYELLTGQKPYQADTSPGLLMKHLLDPVPDILAADPHLPSGLQGIIFRALAKEPERRYQTAGALAAALRALTTPPPSYGRLLISREDQELEIRPLTKKVVTIGRVQANDIVLKAPNVSRRHARLERSAGGWSVVDLGSSNGTYLAENKLPPQVRQIWPPHQPLRIGPFSLRWRPDDDLV